jgi:hypothetical protein
MLDKVKISKYQSKYNLCNKIFSSRVKKKDYLLNKPHHTKLKIYQTKVLSQKSKDSLEKVIGPFLKSNLLIDLDFIFLIKRIILSS